MAYENVVADGNMKAETRAKVVGYLKKLKSYSFLCMVCCYLDILELVTPASKIFEAEGLMPYDVGPVIEETIANINDVVDADIDDDMLTSHLSSYQIVDDKLLVNFVKGDDSHKNNKDKQKVQVAFQDMTHFDEQYMLIAINKKKSACENLKDLLEHKFADFKEPVFQSMKWFDPKNWQTQDKAYGIEEIKNFYQYFKEALDANGFDNKVVFKEWRNFKNYVRINHVGDDTSTVWKSVLLYKRDQYQNLALLAELVICLSGSNSTVERAFSLLTLLLSDKRLKMNHATMNDLLLININDKVWLSGEREAIIQNAVDSYLEKTAKTSC